MQVSKIVVPLHRLVNGTTHIKLLFVINKLSLIDLTERIFFVTFY
nr:MAG TPA: hypothetical protein [Caudoviricetes sp.]